MWLHWSTDPDARGSGEEVHMMPALGRNGARLFDCTSCLAAERTRMLLLGFGMQHVAAV